MPAVPLFHTTCTAKQIIAPGVYELRFGKPADFAYRAGQFVMFDVPHPQHPADVQVRAYSIASAPQETDLLFAIKLVQNGRASAWVEQSLAVGSSVAMRGPLGALAFAAEEKPIVCIATGTGVAPFRSLILDALARGDRRRIDLYIGVRERVDLFWADEWRGIEASHPWVRVHVSMLDGTPDWHGEHGSLQDLLGARFREGPASVYLCGAPDAVKNLRSSCINDWGIPAQDVHMESFV